MKFKVGDKVVKTKGYHFVGEVMSAFKYNQGGVEVERYDVKHAVTDMLHVFSPDQLGIIDEAGYKVLELTLGAFSAVADFAREHARHG